MAEEATIVADLQKIEDGSLKPDVQASPGLAYLSASTLLQHGEGYQYPCLLYTSPSPRDRQKSRMPSSA